jgi:hypothetical protein
MDMTTSVLKTAYGMNHRQRQPANRGSRDKQPLATVQIPETLATGWTMVI